MKKLVSIVLRVFLESLVWKMEIFFISKLINDRDYCLIGGNLINWKNVKKEWYMDDEKVLIPFAKLKIWCSGKLFKEMTHT